MTKTQYLLCRSLERRAAYKEIRPLLKLVKRVKYPAMLGLMATIHAEIAPRLEKIQEAESRLMGGGQEHHNGYGKNYSPDNFRGAIHSPARVNDTGMGDNEPLYSLGQSLKARAEEKV